MDCPADAVGIEERSVVGLKIWRKRLRVMLASGKKRNYFEEERAYLRRRCTIASHCIKAMHSGQRRRYRGEKRGWVENMAEEIESQVGLWEKAELF
jgi:hypothetical protein